MKLKTFKIGALLVTAALWTGAARADYITYATIQNYTWPTDNNYARGSLLMGTGQGSSACSTNAMVQYNDYTSGMWQNGSSTKLGSMTSCQAKSDILPGDTYLYIPSAGSGFIDEQDLDLNPNYVYVQSTKIAKVSLTSCTASGTTISYTIGEDASTNISTPSGLTLKAQYRACAGNNGCAGGGTAWSTPQSITFTASNNFSTSPMYWSIAARLAYVDGSGTVKLASPTVFKTGFCNGGYGCSCPARDIK